MSIEQLGERLQVHQVHISRTNTRLMRLIAEAFAGSDLRAYLTLFARAGLHQTVFTEIRTLERSINKLQNDEEKVKLFSIFFAVLRGIPTSATTNEFRRWLLKQAIKYQLPFPEGHLEALELLVMSQEIWYNSICLVHKNEVSNYASTVWEKLEAFNSMEDTFNNAYFSMMLHTCNYHFYCYLQYDPTQILSHIKKILDASNAAQYYPARLQNKLDNINNRLRCLSILTRYDEYIKEFQQLTPEEQKYLLTPNLYVSTVADYTTCLLATDRIDTLKSFSQWYEEYLATFSYVEPSWRMDALFLKMSVSITIHNFTHAREILMELSQVNRRPHYRRGVDLMFRIRELEIALLSGDYSYADLAIQKTLKWVRRSFAHFYIVLIEALNIAFQYATTKEKRLIPKWKKKVQESVLRAPGEMYFIDEIAKKVGLPPSSEFIVGARRGQ